VLWLDFTLYILFSRPRRGAKYSDKLKCVYMSVCMYVYMSKSRRLNFTKFSLHGTFSSEHYEDEHTCFQCTFAKLALRVTANLSTRGRCGYTLTQNAGLLDVEDYRHNDANVTALQLVDIKAAFTQQVVKEMMSYQRRAGIQLLATLQPPYLTVR